MAEVVRQLVRREAESPKPSVRAREALMNLAGLGRDENPLIDDIPVSERPELYTISPSPSDDE